MADAPALDTPVPPIPPSSSADLVEPVLIGGVSYTSAKSSPVTFVNFVAMAIEAAAQADENTSYSVMLRRARLASQITLTNSKNSTKLTPILIAQLRIPVARQLIAMLNVDDGAPGKVISKGDGVSTSIVYQLGTPIKMGDKSITELEFLASTYAAVEAVMAEDSKLMQAVALVKRVAKPVGMVSMPSWAADKVTLADGAMITNEVLDSFL